MIQALLPSTRRNTLLLAAVCLASLGLGCNRIPGRPGPEPEVQRPDQVLAFSTLYRQNCAACHGVNGKDGAALPLANPVYLAIAGDDRLREIIANGVPNTLMPPFAKSAGGMLTDQQVGVLSQGIMSSWGQPNLLASQNPPPYASTLSGDATRGQQAFAASCSRCHGANGEGAPGDPKNNTPKLGSIVDPSYLALISDQDLRSITIAGLPDRNMPDWRTDSAQPLAQPLTDQQLTDIITWLVSHRAPNPGQPYPTPEKQPAGAAQ